MSLFLGDIRLRTIMTQGLEDISKNPWLLDDILGDTKSNPYLQKLYGTQIESCKQWLANNRINIVLSEREDKLEFPAITIELGSSNEKLDMKHLGDLSTEKERFLPQNINRPIPYVLKPILGSYDPTSGSFTFSSAVDLSLVAPGMILVEPSTGTGYSIQSVQSATVVQLIPGLTIPTATYGIIPQYQHFEARIGHTFMQEQYVIGCHGLDQQTLLWLHSIVVYSLLRYRQSLLEEGGFAESIIKSGKMYPNQGYSDSGQVIWSRDVSIEGQVENQWIMQPHRVIESTGFKGPLKIISNITDTFEDLSTVNWSTIMDEARAADVVLDEDC
jgi:hypothetical protein